MLVISNGDVQIYSLSKLNLSCSPYLNGTCSGVSCSLFYLLIEKKSSNLSIDKYFHVLVMCIGGVEYAYLFFY